MSCYECIYGPTPCGMWQVEGHTMICQVNKPDTSIPATPPPVNTRELIENAEKQVEEIIRNNKETQ